MTRMAALAVGGAQRPHQPERLPGFGADADHDDLGLLLDDRGDRAAPELSAPVTMNPSRPPMSAASASAISLRFVLATRTGSWPGSGMTMALTVASAQLY